MGRVSMIVLGMSGVAAGLVIALTTGCDETCKPYLECTISPGLRYAECGKRQHDFNDGKTFKSASAADEYCHCADVRCLDGGSVKMCNRLPRDALSITYRNGQVGGLEDGLRSCLNLNSCILQTSGCAYGGWYAFCANNGNAAYVTSEGVVVYTKTAAVQSCTAVTRSLAPPCVATIEACSELNDCQASAACRAGGASDAASCASTPDCASHTDNTRCTDDPACHWELP